MKETRYDPWRCVRCDYQMDAAQHPSLNVTPQDGDFSICINCGEIYSLMLGKWRLATQRERIEMPLESKIQLERIKAVRAQVITEDLAFNQKVDAPK